MFIGSLLWTNNQHSHYSNLWYKRVLVPRRSDVFDSIIVYNQYYRALIKSGSGPKSGPDICSMNLKCHE